VDDFGTGPVGKRTEEIRHAAVGLIPSQPGARPGDIGVVDAGCLT